LKLSAFGDRKFRKEYDGIGTTFVIDENGIIDEIDKVKTKAHTDQILK
jgi:peroxiredoxin